MIQNGETTKGVFGSFKHIRNMSVLSPKKHKVLRHRDISFLSFPRYMLSRCHIRLLLFFKLRHNSSKSYLPSLSGLDRSNFLVLIERFLHWHNLLNTRPGTQQHQMCPSVPRNTKAYFCLETCKEAWRICSKFKF